MASEKGYTKKEQEAIDQGIAEVSTKLKNYTPAKGKIEKAKAGDTDAARGVLEEFIGAVNQNYSRKTGKQLLPQSPVEESVLVYLRDCFEELLSITGGPQRSDSNVILGSLYLTAEGKKGRRGDKQRKMDIAYAVMERHEKIKNRKSQRLRGVTPLERAKEIVARGYKLKSSTVSDYYKEISTRWNKS